MASSTWKSELAQLSIDFKRYAYKSFLMKYLAIGRCNSHKKRKKKVKRKRKSSPDGRHIATRVSISMLCQESGASVS